MVLLGTLLAAGVLVVPASAGGANHVVIAQNTTDGATVVHAGTQVVPTAGDTVTSANIAIAANAGCVGCHSTAVAVQILLVTGSPSYFAPGNAASAANGGCDGCGAYAYARQHFIQTSGPAHLSGAVRQRIAELRQEISTAAASIVPSDVATDPCVTLDGSPPPCPTRNQQLDARLNALTAELIQVVTAGVQASGDEATVLPDNVDVVESTPAS